MHLMVFSIIQMNNDYFYIIFAILASGKLSSLFECKLYASFAIPNRTHNSTSSKAQNEITLVRQYIKFWKLDRN